MVPDLVGRPDEESPLRQKLPALNRLAAVGQVRKLAPMPMSDLPEALYLGARPGEISLRPGPLIVSALGADPPDRSLHFHVSLLSVVDGVIGRPDPLPPSEDLAPLLAAASRLNTKLLTFVKGERADHGLVLEALGDLGTTDPEAALGQNYRRCLPEGDHERELRRFVDDSVNLLSELEINVRRLDEGLPPINLLWPWGAGERTRVPNLALRRGERATVESASIRLAGLSRLVGDVHVDRALAGEGVRTNFAGIAQRVLTRPLSVVVLDGAHQLRRDAMEEELHWFVREMDRALLTPLAERDAEDPLTLVLAAPRQDGEGLSLRAELPRDLSGRYPFDERTLEESRVERIDVDVAVREGF